VHESLLANITALSEFVTAVTDLDVITVLIDKAITCKMDLNHVSFVYRHGDIVI
jgi:hypothetical protein